MTRDQPPDAAAENFYIHPGLERHAERRHDDAWLAERLRDPSTRLVPVWRAKNLIAGPREAPRPALPSAAGDWWRRLSRQEAFMGIADGVAYVAIDVGGVAAPEDEPALAGHGTFVDLRTTGPLMPRGDGALLAYARGLLWWHQRHRFCGVCGHTTESHEAGHRRTCGNADCGTLHFPRTDPAVIVLVHDGDRCLLGRQRIWPPGMHSVLAGFLEPGESLEMAVAREIKEEVGIEVADIRYQSSQPWPFPQSLMVGFTARATTTEIFFGDDELEDAGWYSRADLRASPEDESFRLPRRDSIARRLVDEWLAADG